MWPKIAAPTGRIKNPTANAPKAASSDTRGSAAGKNFAARIGAKKPYTAKSYHSSTLPITPAVTTRRNVHGAPLAARASIPVVLPIDRECTRRVPDLAQLHRLRALSAIICALDLAICATVQ